MLFTCCTRFAALTSLTAGSAWDKDQLAIKVRDRFDVQPVDTAAIIKGQITVTVAG